ncbi:SPOR domain-containing protein [Desulfosarcina ovata]|uniref:SPOR domain-containing protein n=1 Tax=Desulfosarcina ovata subsp. ovata TaxID=2752305 RepID=A0A5K8ADC5_9BACT|nr:SPOR domain-containing protein [Desulfosarcina ovata]BBO89994.1 SPOR domain-containing protein [Desulfosarcina ovata subsp. ovata]
MTEGKTTHSKPPIAWGRHLLVFFVAAWMFVLGVLVGRGTAPVSFDTRALEKELVALRDAMMQKKRADLERAIRGEDENAPLEFYEALKSDRPEATDHISAPAAPADRPTAEPTGAPPHKTRAPIMAKKKAATRKAVAAAPVSASRKTPTAASPAGGLTIQVAALKDGEAAERIVANLKKDGYSAYLSRRVITGKGLWFRVRVGSYQNREQAAADMTRLKRARKNPILVEK